MPRSYVVQKIRWAYRDRAEPLVRDEEGRATPLKTFTDRDKAEAYRRRLHHAARKEVIPFEHGVPFGRPGALPSLAAYTSMSGAEFLHLIESSGLQRPNLPGPD